MSFLSYLFGKKEPTPTNSTDHKTSNHLPPTIDHKPLTPELKSQTSDHKPQESQRSEVGGRKTPDLRPPTIDHQPTSPRNYMPQAQQFMQNPQEEQSITVAQLKKEKDNCFLLDVRQPEEVAGGKIPHAIPIPLGDVGSRLSDIPKDKPIITICAHGGRAAATMFFLKDKGYKNVRTLLGGTEAWKDGGNGVE